jgi:hypothetical protein
MASVPQPSPRCSASGRASVYRVLETEHDGLKNFVIDARAPRFIGIFRFRAAASQARKAMKLDRSLSTNSRRIRGKERLVILEMWAECRTEAACAALMKHFSDLEMALLTGRTASWNAAVEPGQVAAMTVSSSELSRRGIRTVQDVLEATECGIRLYHHLKAGPQFRFARVAWEASNMPAAELGQYVTRQPDGPSNLDLQCVLHDELYQQLGSPAGFVSFRDGYWWRRYMGERYSPLYSNDQRRLNDLCRALFPEYFEY